MLREFSSESEKIYGWEIFKILNWIQGYLKKIRKLDVDAFREEGKRFKSQIQLSLAEIAPIATSKIWVQRFKHRTQIFWYDAFNPKQAGLFADWYGRGRGDSAPLCNFCLNGPIYLKSGK